MAIVVPDIACLREPNLLIPGKKPVGLVKIDWGHPLAQKLRNAWIFSNRTKPIDMGKQSYDIEIGRQYLTEKGLQIDASGEYAWNLDIPEMQNGQSILHIFTPLTDLTTNGYLSDHGGGNEFAIIRGYQDGYYNLYCEPYPIGGTADHSQMPMSGVGVTDALCYTFSDGYISGHLNGNRYVYGARTSGDVKPSIGMAWGRSWSASTAPVLGIFHATYVFVPPLTDKEARDITADPYQFLIPA